MILPQRDAVLWVRPQGASSVYRIPNQILIGSHLLHDSQSDGSRSAVGPHLRSGPSRRDQEWLEQAAVETGSRFQWQF